MHKDFIPKMHGENGKVDAWQAERQAHWFTTLEEAFLSFGGVLAEPLVDNAKVLVKKNDGKDTIEFNAEFPGIACDVERRALGRRSWRCGKESNECQ